MRTYHFGVFIEHYGWFHMFQISFRLSWGGHHQANCESTLVNSHSELHDSKDRRAFAENSDSRISPPISDIINHSAMRSFPIAQPSSIEIRSLPFWRHRSLRSDLQDYSILWVSLHPGARTSYNCLLLHGRLGASMVSVDVVQWPIGVEASFLQALETILHQLSMRTQLVPYSSWHRKALLLITSSNLKLLLIASWVFHPPSFWAVSSQVLLQRCVERSKCCNLYLSFRPQA